MKTKRTYQAVPVQELDVAKLLPKLTGGCIVAIDVAKQKFVVALATMAGEPVQLFRFDHPTETRMFLHVVQALGEGLGKDQVKSVMEPTGSYGDAVRFQLQKAGFPVLMMSPHRTHDSQAIFDNVRSLHDGKSAALLARLANLGLGREWEPPSEARVRLRALVEMRELERQQEETALGRLEASLARHWPEGALWLDFQKQATALRVLARWAGPEDIALNADEVLDFMRVTSRRRLSDAVLHGAVESAELTLGVPMVEEEKRYVKMLASRALDSRRRAGELEAEMLQAGQADSGFNNLVPWMGCYTAAVIATMVDPMQYSKPAQLEKACGLNMREKSSGQHRGMLRITKRGPGRARKMLFLFALRMIHESPAVRAWYEARKTYDRTKERSNMRAVVAVMRKLVRAVFHVARGEQFDPGKLFDLRRLSIPEAPPPRPVAAPRTTPRAPARRISGRRRAA